MPKNRESYIRYRVINECLLNKRKQYPTKEELIDACVEVLGVNDLSTRTIEGDIYDMRNNEALGFYAPIKYHAKHKGYYYEDENYSIDKIPLTSDDIEAIHFASQILKQYQNISILKQFSGTVDKITEAVELTGSGGQEVAFMEFDNPGYIKGGEHLNDLVFAIREKRAIELNYLKFGVKEPKSYSFHPYHLKEFNSLWYVIGWVAKYGALRTFALDRIADMKVLDERYEEVKGFDQNVFQKSVYGVSQVENSPEKVVLKVKNSQADYFKVLPIHPSQHLEKEEGETSVFTLSVVPNLELKMKLLSYGSSVEVVEPQNLRKELKGIIESMFNLY